MQVAAGKDEATEGAHGGGYEGQKVKVEELVEKVWRETRMRIVERMRDGAAREHKKMRIVFDVMVRVAGLLTSAPAKRRGT